jgi:hypothetical protein
MKISAKRETWKMGRRPRVAMVTNDMRAVAAIAPMVGPPSEGRHPTNG